MPDKNSASGTCSSLRAAENGGAAAPAATNAADGDTAIVNDCSWKAHSKEAYFQGAQGGGIKRIRVFV